MVIRSDLMRSLLFVPGNRPERFAKAAASPADGIALDLEDSVPPGEKARARVAVAEALASWTERVTILRIRHPEDGALDQDLSVLAPHDRQVVLLPKAAGPADVAIVDAALSAREEALGLATDSIGLMPVIESCAGLQALPAILGAARRIRGASLATAEEGDLMVDLGGEWTPDGQALHYARGKLVCDARAARLRWILDGPFMQMTDDAALLREAGLGRTFGFTGKVAIHPRQVDTINAVFSPTPAQIERAEALLAAYRQGRAEGRGAINFRGMMVDEANARLAEHVLALRPS